MKKTRFISIVASTVVGLLIVGGVGYYIYDMNNRLTVTQSNFSEFKENSAKESRIQAQSRQRLEVKIDGLNKKVAQQEAVLAAREGFLPAVAEAKAAVDSASGKVDVSANVNAIHAAQDKVGAERVSPDVVTSEIAVIKAETQKVKDAVASYDAEQARKRAQQSQNTNRGGGATSTPTGGSGLSTARQALNDVGGSWVNIASADTVCDWDKAVACATTGLITIKNSYAGKNYSWWYNVMMHEYAHQIQFQHWGALVSSPTYKSMFGSNVELLADCMAQARIGGSYWSGYGNSCSADQLNYAANAWNGNF